MLLLFTFSITPKQFLHDLLTSHEHTYALSNEHTEITDASSNFNCDTHSQVVESPFIEFFTPEFLSFSADPVIIEIPLTDPYISYPHFYFELKGPPALV